MTTLTTAEPSLQAIETLQEYCETSTRFLGSFEAFVAKQHQQAIQETLAREWKIGSLANNQDFLSRILIRLKAYAPLEKSGYSLVLVEPCLN